MTTAKRLCVFVCLLVTMGAFVVNSFGKSVDIRFPVLEINSRSYTNVTVTTVEREFICLVHARGMESIRVEELSPELRKQLGCDLIPKPVKAEAPVRDSENMGEVFGNANPILAYFERLWYKAFFGGVATITARISFIAAFLFLCFVAHVVRSFCARAICDKAEVITGFGIWFPNWQWFYLFPAAGMSRFWAWLRVFFYVLLGTLDYHARREFALPILAVCVFFVVVHIVWCFKIANSRDKNGFCALITLLPVAEVIGWLYLAIDGKDKVEISHKPKREIMTLETA